MICIRHSERIDRTEGDKIWFEMAKKYNMFKYDPMITENGKKLVHEVIEKIYKTPKSNKKIKINIDVDNIATSPFTRCIETSIEIQNNFIKRFNKIIPICIEYGLSIESLKGDKQIWMDPDNIDYDIDKKKFFIIRKQINRPNLKYFSSSEIIKRFSDKCIIDKKYVPIISIDKLLNTWTYKTSVNNITKTFQKLINRKKKMICVTHAENLGIVKSINENKWDHSNINYFAENNYCSWIKLNKK